MDSYGDAVKTLAGRRLIDVEMIYESRPLTPADPRPRAVFDAALHSRLIALDPRCDALLIIADSPASVESLRPLLTPLAALPVAAVIANPTPEAPDLSASTPHRLGWSQPGQWKRFRQSDRWARLDAALTIGSRLDPTSALILPAHDAIWGADLLPVLLKASTAYAQNGQPAAVSPYSYYRHSALTGIDLPAALIDMINAAFNRDASFSARLNAGQTQGFWGKTALLPAALCGPVQQLADQTFFEDDLEIDRVLHDLDFAARALWIDDPALYRQTLPIFTESDVRRVILRTLHYSLPAGGSALLTPLDPITRAAFDAQPDVWPVHQQAEAIIADCQREIETRLANYDASWVDWGRYRYVVRPGDPAVETWRLTAG